MPNRKPLLVVLLALVVGLFGLSAAVAQDGADRVLDVDFSPLNASGASGDATITVDGDDVTVEIDASGLLPEAPHAQHIHGELGADNRCPTLSQDQDGDNLVNTPEGAATYGGILLSLTTSGDATPASALAIDRMPVADDEGDVSYSRTFTIGDGPEQISQAIVDQLEMLHIVQHGVDLDDSGAYDGDRTSPLDETLPLEATLPADCGTIHSQDAAGQSRLAGPTRIETAVAVSQFAFPDGSDMVFLARADAFPDALAGGVLTQGPILLVPRCGDLPDAVIEELRRLDAEQVVALGGEAAICQDVLDQAAGV